jgi:hypothetical protein
MSKGRIPKKLLAFITYIITVNEYLHSTLPGDSDKRGIVLGMTTDELTTLDNFVKSLISGDPANPGIWDLHKNPDTKTRKTRKDIVQLMKEFRSFFQPVLNRIAVSLKITNGDRLVLNIADPVTSRTRQKVQIAEYCYARTTPMKSGDIKVRFSTTTDASRASLAPGANGVEIAMRIDVPATKTPESGGDTASKVKYLEHADDGTTKVIYTTASFILKLGGENTGNILQFFSRWIHTSNPGIAGSWTGPFSSLIP